MVELSVIQAILQQDFLICLLVHLPASHPLLIRDGLKPGMHEVVRVHSADACIVRQSSHTEQMHPRRKIRVDARMSAYLVTVQ
ncbi:MAG TPA: hypothetical protein DCS30_06215 [Rhizobiales bacterium]|nr:hypothetical protein [Hyphomicrobiales bacterium]